MVPEKVLRWVRANGGQIGHVRIVGCEPAVLGSDDELVDGLSQPVALAVEEAVDIIVALLDDVLEPTQAEPFPTEATRTNESLKADR